MFSTSVAFVLFLAYLTSRVGASVTSMEGSLSTRWSRSRQKASSIQTGLAFLDDKSIRQVQPSSSTTTGVGTAFLDDIRRVQPCSSTTAGVGTTLLRGALLRIASDLSGGTCLESIKTRVTITREGPIEATNNIINEGGVGALWTGTPSRTVEGMLIGGLYMLGSSLTKSQLLKLGASPTVAAISGGVMGGILQSLAMTPAGMIFTALHANKGKKGYENENAMSVVKRIVGEKGVLGMYAGSGPMVIRQASNWASRAGFTEIARTTFGFSKYGLLGEVASGVIGGVGSCWNTPIETIRVVMQRDISAGKKAKSMKEYWDQILQDQGIPGLFRGVTPRAIQAVWQTVFLIVVPNIMGI